MFFKRNKLFCNIVEKFGLCSFVDILQFTVYIFLGNDSGGIYLCMKVSGDVCDAVVSHGWMSEPAAFLAELTSAQTSSWCQSICVFSGMQSVQIAFLLGKCWTSMIWIEQDYHRGSPKEIMWNLSVVAA